MSKINQNTTDLQVITANYSKDSDTGKLNIFLDSVFPDGLPYGYIHKGITGCGGTTLEMESNRPSIIAVPFYEIVKQKSSIKNTTKENRIECLGVIGGMDKDDIKSYLQCRIDDGLQPKIFVTYDSLPKVIEAIKEFNKEPFILDNFSLLVDELHCFVTQYWRNEQRNAFDNAIECINEIKKLSGKVILLTATPIERDFIFDDFIDYKRFRVDWRNHIEPVIYTHIEVNSTRFHKTIIDKVIEAIIDNDINYYIYYNSPTEVNEIIKSVNDIKSSEFINPDNCSVKYSKDNREWNYLENFRPEKTGRYKKVNFLTSCAFEGIDIYDTKGKTIIINNVIKRHTINDITISFKQIMGRIRNSQLTPEQKPFEVYTLVGKKRSFDYNAIAREVLADELRKFERECEKANKAIPRLKEEHESATIESDQLDKNYLRETTPKEKGEGKGFFIVDRRKFKSDKLKDKLFIDYMNKAAHRKALERDMKQFIQTSNNADLSGIKVQSNRIKFKDVFTQYDEKLSKTGFYYFDDEFIRTAEKLFPMIDKIRESLGHDKVKKLRYSHLACVRELRKIDDSKNNFMKVKEYIKDKITVGQTVPANQLVKILEKAFKDLGIKEKVKATTINRFYNTQRTSMNLDGKKVDAYKMLGEYLFQRESA